MPFWIPNLNIMHPKFIHSVIPTKAGIHFKLYQTPKFKLDSHFRGNDELSKICIKK